METVLIVFSLLTIVVAISCYFKSNECAEDINSACDSPIGLYWLLAVISSALALFAAVTALGVYDGTMAWLLMHTCLLLALLLFSPLRLSQKKVKQS